MPHDEADTPLFEYELTLAEATYHRCVSVSGTPDRVDNFRLLQRYKKRR